MMNFRALITHAMDYELFTQGGAEKDVEALRYFEVLAGQAEDKTLSERLSALQGGYNILVVAEMWCPDCHRNLPAIRAVARAAPHVSLGLITREDAGNEFSAFFGIDKIHIPFAAVLNSNFELLGQFIERPRNANDAQGNMIDRYRKGEMLMDTAREIAAVLFRADEAAAHCRHQNG
ncbi:MULTISPECIES: thioredoxin family protein [Pantoea]|uniref:thioredoxin family protein n=1 Tax=Pantoea TaxID=53335 RepID=UPI001E2C49A8|nr:MULTISPECIES: thioredoxin family protein [Pantoea]